MNKESGSCLKGMSNILNDLGIDEDDFDWWHLAVCRGMDTNLFYEKYEADSNIAKSIEGYWYCLARDANSARLPTTSPILFWIDLK